MSKSNNGFFTTVTEELIKEIPRHDFLPQIIRHQTNPVKVTGEYLDKIYWQGRQWAVTEYGIEARDGNYAIQASRLHEKWCSHMMGKSWIDLDDFMTAYFVAIGMRQTGFPWIPKAQ